MDAATPIPARPLTKEQIAIVRARIAAIYENLRRQGIEPEQLADPVKALEDARDGHPARDPLPAR